MKKQSIYALMSAIALAGAVGFSSCSSSKDDVGEVSPNYNPNTNEALVEFVFNVAPGANHASTRQTADATQAYALADMTTAKFRGIENAHVMCFKDGADGTYISDPTGVEAAKDFDMARVAATNSLGTGENESTTRVLEMSLPINSNQMIFYGRAIADKTDPKYKNKYGYLDDNTNGYNVSPTLSETYFHLAKRLTTADKQQLEEIERLLAGILTCIMETNRGTVTTETVDEFLLNGHTDLKWSSLNTMTSENPEGTSPIDGSQKLTPLEYKLAKVYKEMTTIHAEEGELRNGSAPALLATITDLWSIVNAVRCATATNEPEAYAKYLATQIDLELLRYFTGSYQNDGGPVTGVQFRSIATLINALVSDDYWPGTNPARPTAEVFTEITSYQGLATFPESFALPQGATHLKFHTSSNTDTSKPDYIPENGFYYAVDFNTSAVSGSFTVDSYFYPAELLYFGNSPLRVSDATYKASEYPKTTASWDATEGDFWTTPKDGHSWTMNSHVKTSTRSVAMAYDINYGTALLEATVGYSAATLQDNNAYVQDRDYHVNEPNNTITPTAGSFKLVGVLIGGQYPKVGWDFLPTGDESQGYIYDNVIAASGSIPATGNSDPNYTLVFDNYNSANADNAQNVVYIALELENNTGSGFFGKDNLIPHGSHFYLIGALDPNTKTAPDLPDHHALPPYRDDLTTKTVPRVFIQDHKTTVNFKIGQYSLQYAYLNIPDLRSSSVTLGLSVDLSWSDGIDFDEVVIGGVDDHNPNP